MSWAKVDDRLHMHPKAIRAGLEAMGLWCRALSYCTAYGTDGYIDRDTVSRMCGSSKAFIRVTNRLVSSALWEPDESGAGWLIHDFLDYNPSRAERDKEREDKRKAGKEGAHKRWGSRTATDGSCHPSAIGIGDAPVPSRPVPTPEKTHLRWGRESARGGAAKNGVSHAPPSKRAPKACAVRGTRLSPAWSPKPETVQRFRERERVNALASLECFKNHWLGKSGKDATKVDWERTFVNWVLEDIARGRVVTIVDGPAEARVEIPVDVLPPESAKLRIDEIMKTLAKAKSHSKLTSARAVAGAQRAVRRDYMEAARRDRGLVVPPIVTSASDRDEENLIEVRSCPSRQTTLPCPHEIARGCGLSHFATMRQSDAGLAVSAFSRLRIRA